MIKYTDMDVEEEVKVAERAGKKRGKGRIKSDEDLARENPDIPIDDKSTD